MNKMPKDDDPSKKCQGYVNGMIETRGENIEIGTLFFPVLRHSTCTVMPKRLEKFIMEMYELAISLHFFSRAMPYVRRVVILNG
jgi:hypothetical protein